MGHRPLPTLGAEFTRLQKNGIAHCRNSRCKHKMTDWPIATAGESYSLSCRKRYSVLCQRGTVNNHSGQRVYKGYRGQSVYFRLPWSGSETMSQWHQGKKETSNLNKSPGPKPKQITRMDFQGHLFLDMPKRYILPDSLSGTNLSLSWALVNPKFPAATQRPVFQKGLCLTRLGICEKGIEERSNAMLPKPWWLLVSLVPSSGWL